MINQQMALNLFKYENGQLFWKVKKAIQINIGDIVGSFDFKKGYFRVGINNKDYYIHRIIFLMHYGILPECVDHIDGNPKNNNIENLRQATKAQNQYNSKTLKNNTSGFKNIYFDKRRNKWNVKFNINYKQKMFGSFINIEDAKNHAIIIRKQLHGEFVYDNN